MPTKNFKLQKGDRVIISIKKGSPARVARPAAGNPKAVLKTRPADEYLARRKRAAGINFIDTGHLAGGGSIHVSFLPTISYSSTLDASVAPITDEQKTALVGELEAEVFEIALESFATEYHKIGKTEVFEKAIFVSFETEEGSVSGNLSEIDEWTAQGLKLKSSSLSSLQLSTDGFLFDELNLDFADLEASGIKVTATMDADAPDAAFTPGLKMDVFLMPALLFHNAAVVYNNGFHTHTDENGTVSAYISKKELLNNNYSTLPRSLYDEVQTAFAESPGSYLREYKLMKVINQVPDARALRGVTDFVETPPYDYFFTWTSFSPSSFPFSTIYTPTGVDNSGAPVTENTSYGVTFSGIELNRLVMIIKKNGSYFYFWRVD
jgi:hypothetical protein